nr:mitochondrial uncoupling protein 5-like [Ipomoea batatas]
MAAALSNVVALSLIITLSLSSIGTTVGARRLLQIPAAPPLPTIPSMPQLPTATGLPPMPSLPNTPLPTLPSAPKPKVSTTLPPLPSLPLPTLPSAPKLALPPLPAAANIPLPSNNIPTTIPSIPTIPTLSPPPSNYIVPFEHRHHRRGSPPVTDSGGASTAYNPIISAAIANSHSSASNAIFAKHAPSHIGLSDDPQEHSLEHAVNPMPTEICEHSFDQSYAPPQQPFEQSCTHPSEELSGQQHIPPPEEPQQPVIRRSTRHKHAPAYLENYMCHNSAVRTSPHHISSVMGLKGFVEGGIASIVAGCSTHPLDLIKEGMAALFSGVSATVLRQTLYSTTRMGLYDMMKQKWSDPKTNNMPLATKIGAGLIAGGIGAAVGNPADVAMVRMQADGRLPAAQRRNYKSVVDAITQMTKNEGVTSLWRGSSLTVNRAMLVTASQLASYDQFKETILEKGIMKDGLGTHVTASFAAGFVAAVVTNPVDVLKTRMMNMKVEPGMAPPYAGALDCAMKTIKAEGPMALYKGFIPTISRQGPFTVVLFVTLEQVRKLLKDF